MKEINEILKAYQKIDSGKTKAALATVIHVEGSSYRRMGARMLVLESGQWIGGISGGCLEGDALLKAKQAMVQNKPRIVTYDTREEDAHQIGIGLGCNGLIQVLISPLLPDDERNPLEIFKNCVESRTENLLLTVTSLRGDLNEKIAVGDMFRFENDEQILTKLQNFDNAYTILEDIHSVIKNRKSAFQNYSFSEENQLSVFIEYLPPNMHLVLYGSNYDIYPFARIGKEVGWKVSVVAALKKLDKSVFSIANRVVSNKTGSIEVDENTALILMAHDYKTDYNNLKKALIAKAFYIGVLGPKKRFEKMINQMRAENFEFEAAQLSKIHAPVGLDIGATTPEEIAISIIAEIRAFFAKREGGFLRLRDKPIHDS
jgi:xanthine/CO dehydrogenase XdhC/CoxF family maturation factor